QAHCEYPVSGLIGDRLVDGVIDRTFIDTDGNRWIVDYKTAVPEGETETSFLDRQQALYRDQLATYASLMKGLEERPIRLGLYFPGIAGWRAW
ncbi:MAG: PD-(D/E)XK nuclease family protein, partial [Thiohalorhabdaceae bacterium]